jgi:hypothetical protein
LPSRRRENESLALKGDAMSVLAAVEHEPSRREAFLRHCKTSFALGSSEQDWADNGWPVDELLAKLSAGVKHGKFASGWSACEGPAGEPLASMELSTGSGFVQVVVDPATKHCAFKSSDGAQAFDSLEDAASALARATHQQSASARRVNPVSASHWQGQAFQALAAMEDGGAALHPKRGVEGAQAWQDDFDAIDARVQALCDKNPKLNSVEELDKLRAHYVGADPQTTEKWLRQEIKAGANATGVGGQGARLVAWGAQGAQLRAAIPLKTNGALDPDAPIVAALGSKTPQGFLLANPSDEPMRFYNLQAFAAFCASAQKLDVAHPPGPDIPARLAARREAAISAPTPARELRV